MKKMKPKITLGQLLDLIDIDRETEEFVEILDHDGKPKMRAMVCSTIWNSIEDRLVNSIQADEFVIQVWLEGNV